MSAERTFVQVLKEYQGDRTNKEYAALLGVDASLLTLVYQGKVAQSMSLFVAMLRVFPQSTDALITSLRIPAPAPELVEV